MRWTVLLIALRVPLSCALAMASLAPLGAFSFSPARGMLEGLFDVTGWGAFWAGLTSWLTATACWICTILTLNYGPRRVAGLRRHTTDVEFRPFPWIALGFFLAPLSVLAGICAVSADWLQTIAGAGAGFVAAAAAWLVHRSLYPRPGRLVMQAIAALPKWNPAGYRDPTTGALLSGHWLAAQFAAFFLALWALTGVLKYEALESGANPPILPTSLTYVLLLIGLLAMILSGLAFFFDRYRVPVLLPWFALLAANSLVPSSDHFVETARSTGHPIDAAELVAAEPTPVLVCASGGGIAAAAWTAAVLTGLDRRNPRFTDSLVLFSGASGGSVGGMQFIASCRSPQGCAAAYERAARSSLDAAAWGLVGPDLVRAVVPFAGAALGNIGRGWALEQAWDPARGLRVPMTDWTRKPAVYFNATIVETGEGIGLSNAAPQYEFSAATAARISASFPFVTPTPRTRSTGYHFADGGYYDNYGVGAAVAVLKRARRLPSRILLIEIRASRTHGPAKPGRNGILFQWRSPANTMLNVRDTAQRQRNDMTLDLLTQALAARGVTLERVHFEIPRDGVPLSWHLTAAQTAAIQRDWSSRYEDSPESRAVAAFLSQRN